MEKEIVMLEHKHCTPYLDHNVMYGHIDVDYGSLEKVFRLRGILSTKGTVDNLNNHIGNPNTRLVLRPMSDLKKEITLPNGERFVPIDELNKNFEHIGARFYYNKGYYPENSLDFETHYGILGNILHIIEIYNMLASWHFDFNDLISKGLAVDINSIPLNNGKQ